MKYLQHLTWPGLLLFAVFSGAVPQSPASIPTSADHTVYFTVSASGLFGYAADTDGEADPFVKVFLGTESSIPGNGNWNLNGSEQETLLALGISEYVTGNDPVWNTVFKLDYYPRAGQILLLEVRDHDPVNPDDILGQASVNLEELIRDGSVTKVLQKAKAGSITVTRTTPIYYDLALQSIPAMDWWDGLSDVYVKNYFRVGQEGKDFKFNQTEVEYDAWLAKFERIPFENYVKGGNQILHFRVKDYDSVSGDDDLGEAFLPVDEFLEGNKPVSFDLPDGLILTVTKSKNT